jgi:hypothetical protein
VLLELTSMLMQLQLM